MGENTVQAEKAPKKSWFKGLKSEFKKIVWPDKESMAKQSVVVISGTIAIAIIIALIDTAMKFLIQLFL
jgi:preprotein translocase subunit SecE